MNVWEAAAFYLVGAPVRVREVKQLGSFRGLAFLEPTGQRVIELKPGQDNDDKLNTFLHEISHHRNDEAQPIPDNFEQIAAYIERPENQVDYLTKRCEIRADVFAELMREQIDAATWPHAMDLEFKLRIWLQSTNR